MAWLINPYRFGASSPPGAPGFVGYAMATLNVGLGAGNTTVPLTALTGGIGSAPVAGDLVVVLAGEGVAKSAALTGGGHHATGDSTGAYALAEGSPIQSGEPAGAGLTNARAQLSVSYAVMGSTPDTEVVLPYIGSEFACGTAHVLVWRGMDPATPLDAVPVASNLPDSRLPDPAAITPVTPGAIILAAAAVGQRNDDLVQTYTHPDLPDTLQHRASGGGTIEVTLAGWTVWPGSGAYDPGAWVYPLGDHASASWAAVTLALRPG
ncbi:hypothetical protein GXW74_19760 [Roseomonas eburnea]|uniref:Uncharacterized protein n=1 Tax=Neoroseomonas eburnea TaxID=1346889 RepID=A0A9X9XGA2_9PROT|nr:hypothetical protein [Neoroseomonas eburnea]MBR0682738.1 hypothetical protein [Neoroseomonas eburnea]